jgi:hypothetical protein
MPRKKVIFTEEERKKRNREAQARWRAKHPERARNREVKQTFEKKVKQSFESWSKRNPEKIAAIQKRAAAKRRVVKMQTADWVRKELMRLAWYKEPVEVPRYPRGIGNWAGDAVMRFDCEGLATMLRCQETVMRAKRDTIEFYRSDACGRGDKPVDRLVLGWKGWISNPKSLNRLAEMFGLEPDDYSDLDWSIPEYDSVRAVKNFMGHDLRRIRLGDKWRGWKIVDKELHEWLGRERLRLEAFAGDSGWGLELVSVEDGKLFANFVVDWQVGCELSRADLVRLVEWINERMAGIPLDEWAADPVLEEVESKGVEEGIKRLISDSNK